MKTYIMLALCTVTIGSSHHTFAMEKDNLSKDYVDDQQYQMGLERLRQIKKQLGLQDDANPSADQNHEDEEQLKAYRRQYNALKEFYTSRGINGEDD